MTAIDAPANASRLAVGYGVIVAAVPYLTLKALWVSGNFLGVPDGSSAREPAFVAANAVTGAMDAVAVLVALALTHRWGLRLPAWLVVVPMWVGTGLLTPAAVQIANGGLAELLTGGRAVSLDGGLVDAWVYRLVYASFAVQGVLLATAFVLYARTRWPDLFDRTTGQPAAGATRGVQAVLANAGAVGAAGVAVAHLVMAFGDVGAYRDAYLVGWEYTARSGEVVNAAMAALAAAGILALTRGRGPWRLALTMTWTGAGAMFAHGLLTLVALVTRAPESDTVTPLNGATQLVALIAGLVVAVSASCLLAERRAARAAHGRHNSSRVGPSSAAGHPDSSRVVMP